MKLHEITILEEASRCLLCYDAPCSKACPSSSDPASFIKAIRLNNRRGGARQALQNNSFGGICAAACPASKYCEGACIRGKIDRPVNISMLQGYISQVAYESSLAPEQNEKSTNINVAVLGSGIAGLAAAAELAKSGALVTVYSDGWVWGLELQALITSEKIESCVLDDGLKLLMQLGVELLPSGNIDAAKHEYNAIIIASKKSLTDFKSPNLFSNVFFTGELVTGPNDVAYSIKKGKEAAKRVLDFTKEENK